MEEERYDESSYVDDRDEEMSERWRLVKELAEIKYPHPSYDPRADQFEIDLAADLLRTLQKADEERLRAKIIQFRHSTMAPPGSGSPLPSVESVIEPVETAANLFQPVGLKLPEEFLTKIQSLEVWELDFVKENYGTQNLEVEQVISVLRLAQREGLKRQVEFCDRKWYLDQLRRKWMVEMELFIGLGGVELAQQFEAGEYGAVFERLSKLRAEYGDLQEEQGDERIQHRFVFLPGDRKPSEGQGEAEVEEGGGESRIIKYSPDETWLRMHLPMVAVCRALSCSDSGVGGFRPEHWYWVEFNRDGEPYVTLTSAVVAQPSRTRLPGGEERKGGPTKRPMKDEYVSEKENSKKLGCLAECMVNGGRSESGLMRIVFEYLPSFCAEIPLKDFHSLFSCVEVFKYQHKDLQFKKDEEEGLQNVLGSEGDDVNTVLDWETGRTPLMVAAGLGDSESVKKLLGRGAVVDVVDVVGYTAGNYAIMAGKWKVAEQLEIQERVCRPYLTTLPFCPNAVGDEDDSWAHNPTPRTIEPIIKEGESFL